MSDPVKEPHGVSGLFPCAVQCRSINDGQADRGSGLDWLQNRSYGDDAKKTLTGIQKEVDEFENGSTQRKTEKLESSSANEEQTDSNQQICESQRNEGKGNKRERDYSPSHSSHRKKKKKEKKPKHKHKKKHKLDKQEGTEVKHTKDESSREKFFECYKGKIFIEEIPNLGVADAYRIDRKNDKSIWTYGNLYKMHIANYKNKRKLLGQTNSKHIVDSLEKRSGDKHSKRKYNRYYLKESRTVLYSSGLVLPVSEGHKQAKIEPKSYISLADVSGKSSETNTCVDPHQIMDTATCLYIQGKGNKSRSEEKDDIIIQTISPKVSCYNKQLRENPHNIKLWLEFVDFQDKLGKDGLFKEDGKDDKLQTSMAVIEKKISILEKALSHNPGCIDLQIAHLELCSDIWDTDRIKNEWEKLLFVHTGNVDLWRQYLQYHQCKMSSFSVSRLIKLYHKCLQTLLKIADGSVNTCDVSATLKSDMLDIFVQHCYFLKQVGQTEKAVASFQAMIEFNLFMPEALQDLPLEDCVSVFESFWDSGVARFGENSAKGWNYWYENRHEIQTTKRSLETENEEDIEEELIQESLPKPQMWLKIESFRESLHHLPWRPDTTKNETEEDCEDLDRLVLFDDISQVLFKIDVSEKFRLIISLIEFLGFDCHCASDDIYSTQNTSKHCIENMNQISGGSYPTLALLVPHKVELSDVLKGFIFSILRQSISKFDGHERTILTSLLIHFEFVTRKGNRPDVSKSKLKELRKVVKELLKEEHNRNNLFIWNRYALLEREIGKTMDSLNVLETALTMFSGNAKKDIYSEVALHKLYNSYVQTLLGYHNDIDFQSVINVKKSSVTLTNATLALRACIEGSQFRNRNSSGMSATDLLKFKKAIKCLAENAMLIDSEVPLDLHLMSSFEVLKNITWFEYCRNGMKSSMEFLNDCECQCENNCDNLKLVEKECRFFHLLLERILKFHAQLTIYHMKMESHSLEHLRTIIHKGLKMFPSSSYFLNLFVEVEQSSRITGRLHRHFTSAVKCSNTPLPGIFAILAEIWHQELIDKQHNGIDLNGDALIEVPALQTGITHKVRSLMEMALNYPSSRNCPLLWRLYLQFEAKYGTQSRAKGLFYRALQQCPWSKVLYKDGIRIFGEEQLQEVVDLMVEKEIRVQIPVE